ncbi:MAG: ATPase [Rhodanobacteraceae bacterium]|nr:MAG: ATPase [Rhodanobacteraceae bacterium]
MMEASSTLAIDLGRTGCRAALWQSDAAEPVASANGDGTLGLTGPDGAAVAAKAILAVVAPLLAELKLQYVDAIGIGAPGVLIAPEAARELAEHLRQTLSARTVALASDAVTSHAGALGGEPGAVLAAGTGAVVVAIGPHRQFHHVDGWGPWFGDDGSGAWLGLAGLRAAARAHDGRGPATRLCEAAWQQFDSPEALALKLSMDDNPARIAAAFVPAIVRAAEHADPVAIDLIHTAASALAQSALAGAAALKDVTPLPVAIVGGLTELGAILLDPLRAALARSALPLQVCTARGTSLDGARRLATDGGIHEPWIVRAGTRRVGAEHRPVHLATEPR